MNFSFVKIITECVPAIMSQKSLKQRSMKQMHHKIKQISVPFTKLTIVYLFQPKKNRFREDITISYKHLRKESNIVILRDIRVKQSTGDCWETY